MLEKIIQKNTEKSEISEQLKGLREQLTLLENKIKTAGVPVIITFDGWSAAGKGSMIAKLIRSLDPRFYKVVSYRAPNEQEKRMPWLWRYWQTLPKKGEFLILDRSWYRDTVNAFMYGEIDKGKITESNRNTVTQSLSYNLSVRFYYIFPTHFFTP